MSVDDDDSIRQHLLQYSTTGLLYKPLMLKDCRYVYVNDIVSQGTWLTVSGDSVRTLGGNMLMKMSDLGVDGVVDLQTGSLIFDGLVEEHNYLAGLLQQLGDENCEHTLLQSYRGAEFDSLRETVENGSLEQYATTQMQADKWPLFLNSVASDWRLLLTVTILMEKFKILNGGNDVTALKQAGNAIVYTVERYRIEEGMKEQEITLVERFQDIVFSEQKTTVEVSPAKYGLLK
ncbi:hypothetical protein HK100_006992 [Physocladia obscura]|uniref:Uncharacterized protein n=1 Tax=Physocladia obscura TaxID=109957 RepID=A0AAD5SPW1_9FUNG|nr:hypothetical protein HK100_006992 [Physocladia obscura]